MNKHLLGIATAAALVFSSSSFATPMLFAGFDTTGDGAIDLSVADNGSTTSGTIAISDLASENNFINTSYNGLNINLSSLGANPFDLHLSANKYNTGTMTFGATVTGLTLADISNAVFTSGGAGSNAMSSTAYFDASNTAFGTASRIDGFEWDSTDAFRFLSNQYGLDAQGEFSLTIISTITNNADHLASVDSHIRVPEPSILALFGLGLIGFGFAGRKNKKA